jgi:hypothetical protein
MEAFRAIQEAGTVRPRPAAPDSGLTGLGQLVRPGSGRDTGVEMPVLALPVLLASAIRQEDTPCARPQEAAVFMQDGLDCGRVPGSRPYFFEFFGKMASSRCKPVSLGAMERHECCKIEMKWRYATCLYKGPLRAGIPYIERRAPTCC